MARVGLSFSDRSEISTASKAGWSVRRIARHLGRCPSVISRELHRNSTKTRGYQAVTADVRAQRRRARPQQRKVAGDPVLQARVDADLAASWTPNEIAGRLRLEATDPTVERMANSPDARGRTVSGEAIYQYIYAIPKGELARKGIFLQSKRTKRRPRTTGRTRGGPIVGMVPIAERGEDAAQRRVPGHWEGDLIIGKNGTSCAATLVERMSGFTGLLALPTETLPRKHANPIKRLTALAHALAADGLVPDAGQLAHERLHGVLNGLAAQHPKELAKAQEAVLTVAGGTVRGHHGLRTDDTWSEDADDRAIQEAYRHGARNITPDVARTYIDHLAEDADDEDVLRDAHVRVAALAMLPQTRPKLDEAADALSAEWL
ncbi:IS30 family transposase, partial [Brachybacterium paraconglomeratum]